MDSTIVNSADVGRMFGIPGGSTYFVIQFFQERGIVPVTQRKVRSGKGVEYFWDREQVLSLHSDFKAWRKRRLQDNEAHRLSKLAFARENIGGKGEVLARIEARLERIEAMLSEREHRGNGAASEFSAAHL